MTPSPPRESAEAEASIDPRSAPLKRLHVKTYGCQMNVYDSERMADILAPLGYALGAIEDADLVVLNTCHIREKASEKVYSELGRLKEMREARLAAGGSRSTIVVAGCVAQAEGDQIMARQPAVDFVVGPQAYHQLPELVARVARARGERLAADFAPQAKFDALSTQPRGRQGPSAFLTVQEGCDKFCAFCVVPYTRGAEWSRPVAGVLDEARALAGQGVRELALLGQNVNAYAGEGLDGQAWSLARLAYALAEIPGLARLRYTTSHPGDMGDDLIAAHRDLPALMPYLHLPVQSGSDRVLRTMNRKHTAADYLRLVDRLRDARPDLALTSDFIVGFPGETDADFEATMTLVRHVGYAGAFSFKYSRRPGTPAAGRGLQVAEAVMAERLARLNAQLDDDRHAFDRAAVGATLPVLFEKSGRRPGQIIGKTPYLQAVWVDGPASLIGTLQPVIIDAAAPNSLQGRLGAPAGATGAGVRAA